MKNHRNRRKSSPAYNRGEIVELLLEFNPGIVTRYREYEEKNRHTSFPGWNEFDVFFGVLPDYLNDFLGTGFQSGGSSGEVRSFFEGLEKLEPHVPDETFEALISEVLSCMKIEMFNFIPMYSHHLPPKVRKYVQSLDPLSFIDMHDPDE